MRDLHVSLEVVCVYWERGKSIVVGASEMLVISTPFAGAIASVTCIDRRYGGQRQRGNLTRQRQGVGEHRGEAWRHLVAEDAAAVAAVMAPDPHRESHPAGHVLARGGL